MPGLLFLVLISSFADNSKAAVKPWVTFDPNWNTIFKGSSVTLICNSAYSGRKEQSYKWYRDGQPMYGAQQTLASITTETRFSGSYQCETSDAGRSDPGTLEISNSWLILQAPAAVYEGDTLTMRCHGWDNSFKKEASFYKDNAQIQSRDSVLHIESITSGESGRYRCTRQRWKTIHYGTEEAETIVSVHELFSVPVIKLAQSPVTEGGAMTLTCDTALAPPRQNTELQFAFYREGWKVQDFSASATYSVPSVRLVHSGDYSCEVRTPSGSVRKRSNVLSIHIQELFQSPELQISPSATVREGEEVSLQCVTTSNTGARLLYTFYRDSQAVQAAAGDSRYLIPRAEEEHTGHYMCSVQAEDGSVQRNSTDRRILVQELFQPPELQISPSATVREGEEVSLQCVTTGNTRARLLYTFYRDSQAVQAAAGDSRYLIPRAGEEHSGAYTCSVQAEGGNVQRNSTVLRILVQDSKEDFDLIMEEGRSVVWPVLGTLLLVLLLTIVLLFIYRHRVAPLFTRCVLRRGNTDKTFVKSRDRAGQRAANEDTHGSNTTQGDQEEYSNIPTRGRDVSYAYIDINRTREASSAPTKRNDEYSVTYSAVKCSGTSSETRPSQEMSDPTNIYQNFTAKE